MRLRSRVDTNHGAVVAALEEVGCAVLSLAALGRGCPDLLVHSPWRTPPGLLLLEVKAGRGDLTDAQERFIDDWPGVVYVVRSPQQALEAAGLAVSSAASIARRRTG